MFSVSVAQPPFQTMANWFYYNEQGEKISVTGGQLKGLAKAGLITPDTIVETEEGKTARAGKVKGLAFSETPSIDEKGVVPPAVEEIYGLAQKPTAPEPPPVPSVETNPSIPTKDAPALFCTNCGNSVPEHAVACMSCGARPTGHRKFCRHCTVALNPEQVICVKSVSMGAILSSGAVIELITQDFSFPEGRMLMQEMTKFMVKLHFIKLR